jgi:hypothetical protein
MIIDTKRKVESKIDNKIQIDKRKKHKKEGESKIDKKIQIDF